MDVLAHAYFAVDLSASQTRRPMEPATVSVSKPRKPASVVLVEKHDKKADQ